MVAGLVGYLRLSVSRFGKTGQDQENQEARWTKSASGIRRS